MHRTGIAVVLIYATLLTATALVARPVTAAVTNPFTLRYAANTNGSILLRGNANLVCTPVGGCLNARRGLRPSGESLDNNGHVMINADADGDLGVTTVNDSTATVAVPPGSSVLFAALYWAADTTAGASGASAPTPGNRNRVLFRTPVAGWQPVIASTMFGGGGGAYQSFADVTALVAGAGNGVYGVANIQAGLGQDRYAGWTLAVAYRNPVQALRALRIYDGYGSVSSTSGDVNITVGGFETPHSGTVRAEIGTVVYEGDRGKTGDSLEIDGTAVSDGANPADNFFNSTVSSGGTEVGGRDPGWSNLFGVDIDQSDATGRLGHAATSATLTLSTTSDTYFPGVVTFAIDLYAPRMTTTMTGTDIDGGDLLPGDVIEYLIMVRNDGNDIADDAVISAVVPTWTTYVPGSMRVRGDPVTDTAGDDAGTFAGGRAELVLDDVPSNSVVYALLRVRVSSGVPPGYSITGLVDLSYTGHTAGVRVSGPAAAAATAVSAGGTDLVAGLTVAPAVLQRPALPGPIVYTGTVANNGTVLENAATAELTLPPWVTAGVLPAGCGAFAQVVTCAVGPLAPGTTGTVVIPATVGASASAAPAATLTPTGTGGDTDALNDTATAAFLVNRAPVAVDDAATTTNMTAVNIPVLGNDDDPDGPASALTASIGTSPGHGAAMAEADGTITYTPTAGWAGDDTFTYVLGDADGGTATATVTVRTANAVPVARDDADATPSGIEVIVSVLGNDTDANGDTLTVAAVSGPQTGAGTVRIAGSGTVGYLPSPTFVGQAVIGYTVSDGRDTASAQILVDVANAAPTAGDDLATVAHLGSVTIPVLANDADGNLDPITLTGVDPPSSGTATPAGDDVVYQAAAGFVGPVDFDYTIADNHAGTATGHITVVVANAAPVAADATVSTAYRTPATFSPLAGATDANNDPLHVAGITAAAHGLVVHNPNGTVTYSPADGWSGPDILTVTIADNRGGTGTATITITVLNAPPTARTDAVTLPTGQLSVIDVLANDDDPNGDPLGITIDTPAGHGTAIVSGGLVEYRPAPGWSGGDSFHYTVGDGRSGTSGATVTIELVNAFPVARPDAAVTDTDTTVGIDVLANDSDPNGEQLTVSGWTTAAHGTVAVGPAGSLLYTPDTGFTGVDGFGYTAADPHAAGSATLVSITVRNSAPVAVDDVYTVAQQGTTTLAVLQNDRDANTGQPLTVSSVGAAARGTAVPTAAGTFEYTPAPGATGADTFGYLLRDDLGGTDTATVAITIDAAPAAVDDTASTGPSTPVDVAVLTNDSDPELQALEIVGTGTPAHGFTTLPSAGTVRYAPWPGFAGTDTFRYTVRDPIGNTATAQVTVQVANAPPIARDDDAAALADHPVVIDVLANDTDDNPGQTLGLTTVGTPEHGTATRAGDRVRYTPPAGWSGQDHFRYGIRDDQGGTAEATVEVTVTYQVPYAVADSRSTPYGRPVTVPVLANDLDPSGTLRIVAVTQPDHGSARADDETVTYTPPQGFSGVAVLTYTAVTADGAGTSASLTVTVGTPPTAPDREVVTPPGLPVGIPLPSTDEWGRPATVGQIGRPQHGTVQVNPDGTITYTPEPGFTGVDSFSYEIVDADGNIAYGTITVTVPAPAGPSPTPVTSAPPTPDPPTTPPVTPTVVPPAPTVPVSRTPTRRPTTSPTAGPPGTTPPRTSPPAVTPPPGGRPEPDLPSTGTNLASVMIGSCLACLIGAVLYAWARPDGGRHRRW
ncbi:Ig-like domain-containing protein [Actinoplanes sp. CA-252034]|uniref:Ig-like domain-containing protein n=1 Tax=Actinoplanes sp. CA-252034 TaxID=3239906 RepID=UPI003D957E84